MDCGIPDLSWSNGALARGTSTNFGSKQTLVCPFGFLFSKDNIQEKEVTCGLDAKWHGIDFCKRTISSYFQLIFIWYLFDILKGPVNFYELFLAKIGNIDYNKISLWRYEPKIKTNFQQIANNGKWKFIRSIRNHSSIMMLFIRFTIIE